MLLWLLRLIVGAALLSYAASRDWRTRMVGNFPWATMGATGLLFLGLEVLEVAQTLLSYLILLPPALLLADALWDRQDTSRWRAITLGIYAVSVAVALYFLLAFSGFSPDEQEVLRRGFGVLVVILLAYAFYYFGLLRGGADVKAFISIGILVPGYPSLGPFPLLTLDPNLLATFNVLFPFALATLMSAALLLLALPAYFLLMNLYRGDYRWPQVLVGYKAPIEDLPPFVWVLQEAEDGVVNYYVFPKKEPQEANLQGLRDLGIERVWVTPQVPFLIPLTAAFILTFLAGNLFFALF